MEKVVAIKSKTLVKRIFCYVFGLLILALGLTLNTKTGLGAAPIISVSYSVSQILSVNLGDTTLVLYCTFVVIELILHSQLHHWKSTEKRRLLLLDILQIPLSLIFTRFLNLFNTMLPDISDGANSIERLPLRLAILVLAILCTGIGVALSLPMRLVPNPSDGIVQTIADCIGQSVGIIKNCFDFIHIIIAIILCLLFSDHLIGVGIGTIFTMIGVGRVIALFYHVAGQSLAAYTGMEIGQC